MLFTFQFRFLLMDVLFVKPICAIPKFCDLGIVSQVRIVNLNPLMRATQQAPVWLGSCIVSNNHARFVCLIAYSILSASSTYLSALDREYRLRTSNTATSNHRNHRSGSAQLILPSLTLLHWIPTAQTFASARLASMGIIDDRYGVLVSIGALSLMSTSPHHPALATRFRTRKCMKEFHEAYLN